MHPPCFAYATQDFFKEEGRGNFIRSGELLTIPEQLNLELGGQQLRTSDPMTSSWATVRGKVTRTPSKHLKIEHR